MDSIFTLPEEAENPKFDLDELYEKKHAHDLFNDMFDKCCFTSFELV